MSVFEYESHIYRLDKLRLFYVEVPGELLEKSKKPDQPLFSQRFLISLNGQPEWHGGVVSLGNNTGYITVKTTILKELGLHLGDAVQVGLSPDNSEYGMEFPEELQELLRQDPEAENRFNQLPMSKRRYIIGYVNQVKSSQKKIERALMLLTNLKKLPPGKEDFRGMLGKD
jgi:hypothetical protein